MDNIFIKATRAKLRFTSDRGGIFGVEDLWDLPLTNLDKIAVAIDGTTTKTKSFLTNPDSKATALQAENELKLEILKTVITTREEENKAKLAADQKRNTLKLLKELAAKKQIDAIEGQSLEDINKQIAELEKAV